MSVILGFAPFIAFFALSSLISPLAGLTAGFAISLVMTGLNWKRGKSFKILDVGSLVLFGSITLIILAVAPYCSVGEVGLAVNGGLTLISLLSLAIGRPFTLQYAKEQIPKQYWNTPLFIRTNQLITIVWTLAFAQHWGYRSVDLSAKDTALARHHGRNRWASRSDMVHKVVSGARAALPQWDRLDSLKLRARP